MNGNTLAVAFVKRSFIFEVGHFGSPDTIVALSLKDNGVNENWVSRNDECFSILAVMVDSRAREQSAVGAAYFLNGISLDKGDFSVKAMVAAFYVENEIVLLHLLLSDKKFDAEKKLGLSPIAGFSPIRLF